MLYALFEHLIVCYNLWFEIVRPKLKILCATFHERNYKVVKHRVYKRIGITKWNDYNHIN